MEYSLKNNPVVINQVNPGVFSYWVKVTATAGINTFTLNQTITTGNFNTLYAITSGSNVFYSNCSTGPKPTFLQSSTTGTGGTVTVRWNAPTAGTYIISVKFNSTSVAGKTGPNPTTVHYDFSTVGVSGSTSGINLTKKPNGSAVVAPTGGINSDFVALLTGQFSENWTINGTQPFGSITGSGLSSPMVRMY